MKRSLTAPLVGLGLGATALGGATYVGSSTRCNEGRVVESLAQCQSIVGAANAHQCSAAFAAFSPGAEQVSLTDAPRAIIDRAVFVTTGGTTSAQPVTRALGDFKWRDATGLAREPYRTSCSRSSSSSSSHSGSSSRSSWSSSNSSSDSATHAVQRSGFGSTGRSFSFSSGG